MLTLDPNYSFKDKLSFRGNIPTLMTDPLNPRTLVALVAHNVIPEDTMPLFVGRINDPTAVDQYMHGSPDGTGK